MARLIEGNTYQYINKKLIAVKAKILAIDMSMPVEVAPVVRGQWMTVSYNNGRVESQRCSVCGAEFFDGFVLFAYCPDCGAKMDLEEV